ncbi:MAG: sensor histidine kinase [Clostridiaceae bacterium]|nr:sensor histidine kinase [Clostridiaceae bacterium]
MKRQMKTTWFRRLAAKTLRFLENVAQYVTGRLDNLKLRDKMIITTVVCVLLPIAATNIIFYSMMYSAEKERQENEINNTLKSVEVTLDNMIEYLTGAAANLYTTKELYPFLDEQYRSGYDYLIAYKENSALFHKVTFGNNTYISNVQIYCDNNTLVNGGGINRLDTARDSEWYKRFVLSGRQMAFYPSLDSKSETDKRELSLLCQMDYKINTSRERIIKLNLNYNYFTKVLNQQYYNSDIFICDSEHVLFSSVNTNKGTKGFTLLNEMDFSDARYMKTYDVFGETWNIYLYPHSHMRINAVDVLSRHGELFVVLVFINMLLPAMAIYFINRSITRRIIVLSNRLQMVKEEKYVQMDLTPSKDEIGELVENYNRMVAQIDNMTGVVFKEKIMRQEYELAKQRAELQALHSQINPHFIFNALESIRMRSLLKKEDETAKVIEFLAVLMRKSTDWWDDCVTLADEVNFAEAYLKLQQYRFGSRLSYELNISDHCLDFLLPKLTLVTFVENACVHGVEKVSRNCMVLISAEMEDDFLAIYVEDTGAGMKPAEREEILKEMREGNIESLRHRRSVGILNACLRLRKYFGDDTVFEIDSEPQAGTCITIRIPIEKISRFNGGSEDA